MAHRYYCQAAVISRVPASASGWINIASARVIAEFDDSALMKAFGQQGAGIFIASAAIEAEVELQYQVTAIGRVDEIKEQFYAISVERRIKHPVVVVVVHGACGSLFTD